MLIQWIKALRASKTRRRKFAASTLGTTGIAIAVILSLFIGDGAKAQIQTVVVTPANCTVDGGVAASSVSNVCDGSQSTKTVFTADAIVLKVTLSKPAIVTGVNITPGDDDNLYPYRVASATQIQGCTSAGQGCETVGTNASNAFSYYEVSIVGAGLNQPFDSSKYGCEILGTGTRCLQFSEITFNTSVTTRTLSFGSVATQTYNTTQTVTATASAGTGTITYSSSDTGKCTVDSNTGVVTATSGTGQCTITASVASDGVYSAATASVDITLAKATQATFNFTRSTFMKVWDGVAYSQDITFTPSGGSGTGSVSYSVSNNTATNCSLVPNGSAWTISADTGGQCRITAVKAGDSNYLAATFSTSTYTGNSTYADFLFQRATLANPTSLSATPIAQSSSLTVSFTKAANATDTQVALFVDGATTSTFKTATISGTSYTFTGLTANTPYFFATKSLAATNDAYYFSASSFSSRVSATTNTPTTLAFTTPTSGLSATKGSLYSLDLSGLASGGYGSKTFTTTGSLPAGLSLSGSTISGTPTTEGSFSITSTVRDEDLASATTSSFAIVVAPVAPTITSQPASSSTVGQGGSITLSVTATGTALSYQWKKDGTVISGATSSSLVLNPVGANDGGTYTVDVKSTVNSVTSAATTSSNSGLVVVDAPAISTQPANSSISDYTSASFSVTASVQAGGTITYQWQSSPAGSSVYTNVSGGAYSGATTSTLSISNSYTTVSDFNGRKFRVLVTNTKSSTTALTTSSVATLSVYADINWSSPPTSVSTVIGSAYSYDFSNVITGGVPTKSFELDGTSNLPSGLSFDTTTGVLSGSPARGTVGTNYFLKIKGVDALGLKTSLQSVRVNVAKATHTSATNVTATLNSGQLKSFNVSWSSPGTAAWDYDAANHGANYTVVMYETATSTAVLAIKGSITTTSVTISSADYSPMKYSTDYYFAVTANAGTSPDYSSAAASTRAMATTGTGPPVPTVQPLPSSTYFWDGPSSLSVTATGTGTLSYKWKMDTQLAFMYPGSASIVTTQTWNFTSGNAYNNKYACVEVYNTVSGVTSDPVTTCTYTRSTTAGTLGTVGHVQGMVGDTFSNSGASASGGYGSWTYSISSSPGLPNGLTLNTSTGVISGTALEAVDRLITLVATDLRGLSTSKSVKVGISTPITLTTSATSSSSLTSADVTFSAEGGTSSAWYVVRVSAGTATGCQFEKNGVSSTSNNINTSPLKVKATSKGTCLLTAAKLEASVTNSNFLDVVSPAVTFTFTGTSQTISFSQQSNVAYSNSTFNVPAPSASSGLTVSLQSDTPSVCTNSSRVITIVSTGTCSIRATQAGNSTYAAATDVVNTFEITQKAVTVTALLSSSTMTFGGTQPTKSFTVSGLVGSDAISSVTYTYSTSNTADAPNATGTHTLTPSAAVFSTGSESNYNITYATASLTVNPNAPAISSQPASQNKYVSDSSATFSVSATAAVGSLSYQWQVSTDSGSSWNNASGTSTNSSYVISSIQTGLNGYQYRVIVTATSNSLTASTTSSAATLTVKVTQSISQTYFATTATGTVGDSKSYSAVTATSGLTVAFTTTTPSICTVSGTSVTLDAPGDCVIKANQTGNSSYYAATERTQTITVAAAKIAQTITFSGFSGATFGDSPVAASVSTDAAGLTVVLTSRSTSVCTVSGSTVTIVGAGTCSISANQSGDNTYNAASQVTRTFTVAKKNLVVTSTLSSSSITYGATPPTSGFIAPALVGNDDLTVTQTYTDAGSYNSTIQPTAVGSYTLTPSAAVFTSGSADNYNISYATASLAIVTRTQSISFTTISTQTFGVSPITAVATATSGLTVSFTSSTTAVCTVSGSTITILAVGTCTIAADQAGNSSYSPATTVTKSFTVSPKPLTQGVVTATSPAGERMTISATWTAVTNATGYVVKLWSSGTTEWKSFTVDANTTSQTFSPTNTTNLVDNAPYTVSVMATGTGNYTNSAVVHSSLTYTRTVAVVNYNPQQGAGYSPSEFSGTLPSQQRYINGAASPLTVSLNSGNYARVGYDFMGWNTQPNGSGITYTPGVTTTYGDINLWPMWERTALTVTFNSNYGTATTTTQTFEYGVLKNLDANTFTRTGYAFAGWATTSGGSVSQTDGSGIIITSSRTLYAKWTAIDYTVTYAANGSSATVPTETAKNYQDTVTVKAAITRTGYDFQGWSDGTTTYSPSATLTMPARNVTLTALWQLQVYTITYNDASALSGSPSRTSDDYTYGYPAISLPTEGTLVKTGYNFGGWSVTLGGSAIVGNYTPTSSKTLYAVWTPITYTVTYNSNGATGALAQTSDSYTTGGTAITLPGAGQMTKAGHTFDGWSTTTTGSKISGTYTTSTNRTLYARWVAVSYTITYDAAGGSSTPTQANKTIGQTFTLAAGPTKTNFEFAGWNDGTTTYDAGYTYVVEDANITLTAEWVEIFWIHYNYNGANETEPADLRKLNGQSYTAGDAVTKDGYTFGGWKSQSNVSIAAGQTFTVNANNFILSAQWTPINYHITYASAGGVVLPTEADKNISQTFTVANAPTRSGYTFNGWNDGALTYGPGATYTVTASNVTLTAQWTPIQYDVTYDLALGTSAVPVQAARIVGQTFAVAAMPSRYGYSFVKWTDGTNDYQPAATYTMPSNDVTLTAVWQATSLGITYNLNGGSGTAPTETNKTIGSTFSLAGIASWLNHTFLGWFDGTTLFGAGDTYMVSGEPVNLVARWLANLFSANFLPGGASGSNPTTVDREAGQTFSLPSASGLTKASHTFAGWTDGLQTYQPGDIIAMPSQGTTFTALWTPDPTPPSSGGGSGGSGGPSGPIVVPPTNNSKTLKVIFGSAKSLAKAAEIIGTPVKWKTESPNCKVDAKGVVTTVAVGECSVTAIDKATLKIASVFNLVVEPRLKISLKSISNLKPTSARLNASVAWPGSDFQAKFCVATSATATDCKYLSSISISNETNNNVASKGAVSIARDIQGLTPGTRYFVHAAVLVGEKSYKTAVQMLRTPKKNLASTKPDVVTLQFPEFTTVLLPAQEKALGASVLQWKKLGLKAVVIAPSFKKSEYNYFLNDRIAQLTDFLKSNYLGVKVQVVGYQYKDGRLFGDVPVGQRDITLTAR